MSAHADPFADDVLERLARSNGDYQREHGHYIVPLSERLLAARAENQRLRDALERIATDGGWVTTWRADEAEPESGEQPSISNQAQEIARAALAGTSSEDTE
jgi:hypothetical protein